MKKLRLALAARVQAGVSSLPCIGERALINQMNHKGLLSVILVVMIIAIIAVGGYFVFAKKSLFSNTVPTAFDERIAACYPKNEGCSACQPILNNSIQRVVETSRLFVNVPKDFYPKEISSYFTTVSGNATVGWISNGGLPGEGLDATPECWSTYYEFDGSGEVDLRVKSIKAGVPDYFVRFIVGASQ